VKNSTPSRAFVILYLFSSGKFARIVSIVAMKYMPIDWADMRSIISVDSPRDSRLFVLIARMNCRSVLANDRIFVKIKIPIKIILNCETTNSINVGSMCTKYPNIYSDREIGSNAYLLRSRKFILENITLYIPYITRHTAVHL